jgi:tRNA(adenine34) deaminase
MQPRDEDVAAMLLALAQAERAAAAGEVPIGAVLLGPDGAVIATGANSREGSYDPTAHAELTAIRVAAEVRRDRVLTGCTLAVTLEPCPMCAGAAWLARVDRVVFGAWNPDYGAAGSMWDLLRDGRLNHRPEVVAGVLAAECAAILGTFFTSRR